MNCLECQELLQERLDGAAPVDSTLDQHLAVCHPCRELHASGQLLEKALLALHQPVPPAALAERIVGRVLAEREQKLRFRRRLTAALAASLLLLASAAVLLGGKPQTIVAVVQRFFSGPNSDAIRPGVADNAAANHANNQSDPADQAVSLSRSIEEAGSALADLSRRTADETIGQTSMVLPDMPVAPLGSDLIRETLAPPAQSLQEAGRGVSEGLEPLTTSARRAVSLFLKEFPPADYGADNGI